MSKWNAGCGWLVFAGVVLFLLWAISMPNIIKLSDKSRSAERGYRMALSSGEDYIGDRGGSSTGSAPAAGAAQDNTSYYGEGQGGQPAEQAYAKSRPAQDASAQAQTSSQIKSGLDSAPEFSSAEAGLVQSWFLPSAYAADHKLDERYLKRTGSCSLQVEKYEEAANKLAEIARGCGGMISDTQSQRQADDSMTGTVTLRVPSDKFPQAWAAVLGCGKLLSQQIATEDVGHEYLGYVSHMKNLVAEQAALQKMLNEALAVQRSRGLGEGYKILLDTQERLFNVTGELESTEDSLNALADQITRSTITAQLTERKELPAQVQEEFTWGVGTTAAQAYQDLRISIRHWVQSWVYFLITCWTWLIPWAIVILLAVWFYRGYLVPRGVRLPALVAAKPSAPSAPVVEEPAPPEKKDDKDVGSGDGP
jgi:hypothetical protein